VSSVFGVVTEILVIGRESADQPAVSALLALADERSAALYPAESRHGLSLAALLAQDARFFVARLGSRAVGCGGYVLLPGGSAEMKRVFTVAEARGQGIGRAIVQAIEAAAAGEGLGRMYLETGVKSDEAIRLYRRLGYVERGPFAGYGADPLSVFMVKTLVDGGVG
jgi:putative acetyltransferase